MKFLHLLICCFLLSACDGFSSAESYEAVQTQTKPQLQRMLIKRGLNYGASIFIRIFKQPGILEVWLENEQKQFELFKTYDICYYSGKLGPKLKEGDKQSPEGFYFVTSGRMNPNSSFHLSFNLGFPNAYDRAHQRTGSYLMVHGDCVSIGCYAMTDKSIEEIYLLAEAALNQGQPFFRVHIFPFPLTSENLQKYQDSPWLGFWQNLKTGYDWFEQKRRPPDVNVKQKRYVFTD